MKITAQRLRNLTTGRLHTQMEDIYKDLETITGMDGLFTHMLPGACEAALPWLEEKVTDERYWDGEYDPTHEGEYDLPNPTEAEKKEIQSRYDPMYIWRQ